MASLSGRVKPSWLVLLLAALMLVSMTFVGFTFQQLMVHAQHERLWITLATAVQVESQKLAKSASEAASGNIDAFEELSKTHLMVNSSMRGLRDGDGGSLPPVPSAARRELTQLDDSWQRMSANATSIIQRRPLMESLDEASTAFRNIVPEIQSDMDRVTRQLIESGATNPQVFAASRQLLLADRMLRHESEVRKGGSVSMQAAEDLRNEIALFDQQHTALLRGNTRLGITPVRNQQSLATLARVRQQFEAAQAPLATILDSSQDLFELRGAADQIFIDSEQTYQLAGALTAGVADLPRTRTWPSTRMATIGLLVLIALVAALVIYVIAVLRRRADVATTTNRRSQKAIMRLLDELSTLADRDLRVQATVSDEVTGAIADAVNYAIEQLREVIIRINHTARAGSDSAQATSSATSQLAESAEAQATEVVRASEKVQSMADSFGSMAGRCQESSQAAVESVSIANKGALKVRETIDGMDTIREQIQETSKRIKRLGESTQEIGDIVSLINDIAEQTNVLALNAAIQAASSGSGGKGFGVVADEVQRLAESATAATRRISSLVQTIQADTAEAVASMENTTSEVVNGAQLAQDAGQALVHIERVSNELKGLIQEVSGEALSQSKNAERIAELMDGIREVSLKTAKGTSQSAESVARLAAMVLTLRDSVADFKLPEDG
jgi:twitching motility protein PilJ